MSTDVSTSLPDFTWSEAENPLKLFRPELDEVERQLLQSYDELESLSVELAESEADLERQRENLERERAELTADREQFVEQQAEFLRQSQSLADHSTPTHEELLAWQEKLLQSEQEIETLREQLTSQTHWIDQHKQERFQHEEQYKVLEVELEHVRNRAGELFDTLACSRTEWETERRAWEQERKELQSLLAQQQAQINDYLHRHEIHPGASPPPTVEASAVESTTKKEEALVVGSVLAQFERIRNERAVRRRKASEGG